MNKIHFQTLLHEMDSAEMARHSVRNHHVDGLDYLCLHRSEKLTVKLYFIDPYSLAIKPGQFLVTPHTHRYAFESTVLCGYLEHIRFDTAVDDSYEVSSYSPENRSRTAFGHAGLNPRLERHGPGSVYWCSTADIHTLTVPDEIVLLGLVQYGDTRSESKVYVKKGCDMVYPESRTLIPAEVEMLRGYALGLMK